MLIESSDQDSELQAHTAPHVQARLHLFFIFPSEVAELLGLLLMSLLAQSSLLACESSVLSSDSSNEHQLPCTARPSEHLWLLRSPGPDPVLQLHGSTLTPLLSRGQQ
ncbi:unnamed protein product [Pleuronectes platessa]|uniref:Uncharacterized protein n=1 Tax=Pleuronectes platessa TaxID=8262 RepID=A0A9N7Y7G8_PLEPL|nr:unnamed protein product [Pleuronectes platessa]